MRREAFFTLFLLLVWCGGANARTVVYSVAEERKDPGSDLWKSRGVVTGALVTAEGAYRTLPRGTVVRFVTRDTLEIVEGGFVPWDPLRSSVPPVQKIRLTPCDSVMALLQEKDLYLGGSRAVGFGEGILGYVSTDSIYHPLRDGRVWSAHPNSLEIISSATDASRPGQARVPRDSVLAFVLTEPPPKADKLLGGTDPTLVWVAALASAAYFAHWWLTKASGPR